jgi:nucleotide-binding universal stress UspA family protein
MPLRRKRFMNAIQKILVPTDFSGHADEALRVAVTLAQLTGAEVILFHVAQPPAVVTEAGPIEANPGKGEAGNLWKHFEHAQPTDPKVRVTHEVIVADGPGAGHILEILERLGCDLVVMGTHGRSWLKHRLFGSVTEEVVRRAPCPVMVVKVPASAQGPPAPNSGKAAGAVPAHPPGKALPK